MSGRTRALNREPTTWRPRAKGKTSVRGFSRHDDRRPGLLHCIRFTAGVEGGPGRSGEANRRLQHATLIGCVMSRGEQAAQRSWSRYRGGAWQATEDVRRRVGSGQSSSSREARGVGIRGAARCCSRDDTLMRARSCSTQEEGCAGIADSPEAGAANSGATSLRLGQRELRWALVSSCSARKMGGRRPEKRLQPPGSCST